MVYRLNLGSGALPKTGYVNVDRNPAAPGVNLVHDLDIYPWPFADASVDELQMEHCLEHLVDHNRAMKEIHRILKPGARARIVVPHFTWQLAWSDPTHRHFFGYHSFEYYTHDCGYFDFRFAASRVRIQFGKTLSVWNYLVEPFANCFPDVWEQSPLRMFPAVSLEAILVR